MQIRELFDRNVTRDIPPVIYFHEQTPEKLKDEVSEYIVTGGYPEDHPHHKRVASGIHEQYVRLLQAITAELGKKGGPELPASWISGFYGSGKSIFAKLLGLSLDGAKLPDGAALAEAWLRRDTSPLAAELREAWEALLTKVTPIACVFDVGGIARDNEHIHSAVVRQVQKRLGYCGADALVADFELRLERDGEWERFLETAKATLGHPWDEALHDAFADDQFSEVLHRMFPERYTDPLSWIQTRGGTAQRTLSPEEATLAIADMLRFRAEGKTLFLVVDEVSQYIHQDSQRMLKLQSFVSSLGQRLKGRVWLLVTGQEKLEEESEATTIGKMKDRFPERLRVHLSVTNIRDVVHKRLLQKSSTKEAELRELFRKYRANLRLYAYGGERITEEDFVEVYPMLPGHIDLLMQITSALRTRSSRSQGDDHAIRGLLQLLGELFRSQRLAEKEVGALVTLDSIFEVQQTALDSDIQTTLSRIFEHCAAEKNELAARAARAVALLELIQDQVPTDAKLVAACLYDCLERGDRVQAVTDALESLRKENLLGYSEKHGYKIQSSAGQEWERERKDIGITPEQRSELIQEKLKYLLGTPELPRFKQVPFKWSAWYTDGRQANDVRLLDPRNEASMAVDFRLATADDRNPAEWVRRSDEQTLRSRLLWVVGETSQVEAAARELGKTRRMLDRYRGRKESLTRDKQRLLLEEEARGEDLEKLLVSAIEAAWMQGSFYFQGRPIDPKDMGGSFATALTAQATRVLPDLFQHFTRTVVTETELLQLLEPALSGVSPKFLEGDLGILSLDAGRYHPTCSGQVPARILKFIEDNNGTAGSTLFAHFSRPPYGFSSAVTRACLAGLLRAGKIRIRPPGEQDITSVRDQGTKEMFRLDTPLRHVDLFPAGTGPVTGRDRVALCTFFEEHLSVTVERENDAIADAIYQQFPLRAERLRQVEARLNQLPGAPPSPEALQKLGKAIEECRRSRQVEDVVVAAKHNLDALRDGVQLLGIFAAELTDQAIARVRAAQSTRNYQLTQLREIGALTDELAAAGQRLEAQLGRERPWQEIEGATPDLDAICQAYVGERQRILSEQEAKAQATRDQVKRRPGFEKLSSEQSHQVLRPISTAVSDTTPEAIAPSLRALQDQFTIAIRKAEEEANERLDEILSTGDSPSIVKVSLGLRNRVISAPRDLDALLSEIRERVAPHLEKKTTVRLT